MLEHVFWPTLEAGAHETKPTLPAGRSVPHPRAVPSSTWPQSGFQGESMGRISPEEGLMVYDAAAKGAIAHLATGRDP